MGNKLLCPRSYAESVLPKCTQIRFHIAPRAPHSSLLSAPSVVALCLEVSDRLAPGLVPPGASLKLWPRTGDLGDLSISDRYLPVQWVPASE